MNHPAGSALGLDTTVELLNLLGDPTRVRLMALLGREELTVAELTSITGLSQSRVSTHLRRLKEAGLLRDRREGASSFYAANDGAMPEHARKVWSLLERELADRILERDRERCDELLRSRGSSSVWPETIAGEMERHYSPGRTWEATARGLLGFVRLGRVLDAGAGDGVVAQLLAPRARRLECVDRSERVIEAARRRLAAFDNVRCRVADLHDLPYDAGAFDQVLLFNVLTYSSSPADALAEAVRVLAGDGTLAIVTLRRHDRMDLTSAYHHTHPGFEPDELADLVRGSGLTVDLCEVTSRERRKPHFEVISAFARKGRRR